MNTFIKASIIAVIYVVIGVDWQQAKSTNPSPNAHKPLSSEQLGYKDYYLNMDKNMLDKKHLLTYQYDFTYGLFDTLGGINVTPMIHFTNNNKIGYMYISGKKEYNTIEQLLSALMSKYDMKCSGNSCKYENSIGFVELTETYNEYKLVFASYEYLHDSHSNRQQELKKLSSDI